MSPSTRTSSTAKKERAPRPTAGAALAAKSSSAARPAAKKAGTRRKDAPSPAALEQLPEPLETQLKLDLLPRVSTRPFRTELTVESNSLFVGNSFRGDSFQRESLDRHPKTGREILRRMTVGRLHDTDRGRGVLRQQHQDAYFKLLELWGNEGYPLGTVRGKRFGLIRASAYELVTKIYGGFDNVRAYRRTRELLRDLQAIPIVLENVDTWAGLKDREEFTLLSEVTWSEKLVDEDGKPSGKNSKSLVTVMLSSMVTEGYMARHFKVLLGQPYDALGAPGRGRRNETARLLYPFLDLQLQKGAQYEASLDALAQHFGLQRYAHRSKRKEKFESAVAALRGKPILEGNYALRIELVEQRDDYVLRASRAAKSA